jgi:hypothetical protein
MPPILRVQSEPNIQLAIQAFKSGQIKTIGAAARTYRVDRMTVTRRIHGTMSRRDTIPNSRKLTPTEEESLLQRILELDQQGFPPRVSIVREYADIILETRGTVPLPTVGANWATNFIKRQDSLKTRWNRKYDYQRAQCEDRELISGWFRLVQNIIAKYGITEDDIYNFDETGFAMGVISVSSKVVTSSDTNGRPKTRQPGNRDWVSVIHGVNARGWSLPAMVILAGIQHQASWYTESNLPRDWVLAVSEKGWTDDEIGFE